MTDPKNHDAPWIDAHLDLTYVALDRAPNAPDLSAEPDRAKASVSWNSLARGRVRACLGTIFTAFGEPDDPCGYVDHDDLEGAHRAGMRQLELYETWERAGLIRIARSITDVDAALAGEGPPAVVLLMECADPIRRPDEAASWVERGVSMVGLSWSAGSRYSGGNGRAGGLTTAGRELVAALDEAGAAHDVSHLADQSVDDLLACARGPIASTHSNARSVHGTGRVATRNLSADHAVEIAARGGVAGINLFTRFLTDRDEAEVADVVAHANSLAEAFGRERIGLGSDLDGGFGPDLMPSGIDGPEDLDRLLAALEDGGWSKDERAGFRCGAWRSFLGRIPRLSPANG